MESALVRSALDHMNGEIKEYKTVMSCEGAFGIETA